MSTATDNIWADQTRDGRLHAYMIPPGCLEDRYDELKGIDWAASSITADYYTDTRTQGKLVFVGDGWIRNSLIRIVYEIKEWDYERVLGTYIVTNDNSTRQNGQWKTTLELNSMLYAMNLHKPPQPLILAQNSTALVAIKYILDEDQRAYNFKAPNDVRMGSTQILEGGQSELSRLYAVASMCGNRVDVDGHGYVTIEPYVSPAAKTPSQTIDLLDPRGVAYDGLERSTDWLRLPSEAVVVYRYTDNFSGQNEQYEITATATVSSTSHASNAARGYTLTDFHSETELDPPTQAQAQRLAEDYLAKASVELREWKIKTKYLPLWEGDVINLVVPDGEEEYRGTRKCLVKSIDMSGPYLDMSITLKETSSGDEA